MEYCVVLFASCAWFNQKSRSPVNRCHMELIHVTSLFILNDICEQSLFRLLRRIMSEHVGDGVRPSVMSNSVAF